MNISDKIKQDINLILVKLFSFVKLVCRVPISIG